MGDFAQDTAVEQVGPGRYRGALSPDWEIWGPAGGYVAALALRAAACESTVGVPASFTCHFLGVGAFDEVDAEVAVVRRGRSTESLQVLVRQGERLLLHAVVLTAAGDGGYDHHEAPPPPAPGPEDLLSVDRRWSLDQPVFPFWLAVDARSTSWQDEWPPSGPLPPASQYWMRLVQGLAPGSGDGVGDRWLDAARSVLFIDVVGWPAAHLHHAWRDDPLPWYAPSADLHVAFHQSAVGDEWALVEGTAPVAAGGLIGTEGRLWSSGGALVASSRSQLLWRPMPGG
jgi:acyl-CoA thioesterase-2